MRIGIVVGKKFAKTLNIRNEYGKMCSVIKMEKRAAKIIVGSSGGTAGKDSKTYKLSLPSKWVHELSLNEKQIELCFDGEKIIISPALSFSEFCVQKKNANHCLVLLDFYDGDILCTKICADFTDETLVAENFTDNIVKTAFGKKISPDWEDFNAFLRERCVSEDRSGIREYLEVLGVEEYNPLKIIEKTQGRMAEDNQWLKVVK